MKRRSNSGGPARRLRKTHASGQKQNVIFLKPKFNSHFLKLEINKFQHIIPNNNFLFILLIKFQLFIIYYLFEILIKLILSFPHNAKGMSLLVLIFLYFF